MLGESRVPGHRYTPGLIHLRLSLLGPGAAAADSGGRVVGRLCPDLSRFGLPWPLVFALLTLLRIVAAPLPGRATGVLAQLSRSLYSFNIFMINICGAPQESDWSPASGAADQIFMLL